MSSQQITAEARVGQQMVSVLEAEWKTRKIHDASQIEMKVLPDDPLDDLSDALRCRLYINGYTIASGSVFSAEFNDDGTQTVTAYDAARKLHRFKMTRKFDEDPIREAFDIVCENAFVESGQDLSTTEYEGESGIGVQLPFTYDAADEQCWTLLNKISLKNDWLWYVDAFDRVWITDNVYEISSTGERENNQVSKPGGTPGSRRRMDRSKQLVNILEHSDGLAAPPYQKVVVNGDASEVSDNGDFRIRLSKNPAIGAAQTDLWSYGDPIYTHSDKSIRTSEQAIKQATAILKSFREQQKGGTITVAGRADIRPLDIVTLPDQSANEDFFGESYIVSKIEHTLKNSDGFKTKLHLGGLVDDGEGWVTTSQPEISAAPERTVTIGQGGEQEQEQEQGQDQPVSGPDADGRQPIDQDGDSRPDYPQEGEGTPDEDATIDPPSLPSGSDPEPDDVRTPGGRNDYYTEGDDSEDDEDDEDDEDEN
jgi:hypothetical protein